MRPSDFFASTTFRLGLLAVGFFVAAVTLVFWLTYRTTAAAVVQQLDENILSDFSELAAVAGSGSLEDLRRNVEARVRDPAAADGYYALLGPSGERLAGNLPVPAAWAGWFEVGLGQPGRTVRAYGQRLRGGAHLVVGRDRADVDGLRGIFVRGFLAGVGATVLLTLACNLFVAGRVLARIEAINRAAGEIIRGDLTRRVPTGGRGDEFDRLAGRLNAMLDRIAVLMGQVRQVTDDIAHDLRTPLSRLRHRLDLARRRACSIDEYEAAIDGAISEADAVIGTFASLLRIAQVEAGARRSAFRAVDLSGIAEALVETYAPVAEDRGQSLSGHVEPGVRVLGDRQLLGQLLANLIENALHHTPPGSRVSVRLHRDGRGALAQVVDDGLGIPPEMRSEVLKRFVRLDKSRATPGSGLGLSLVAAIVELHGATLGFSDAFPGGRPPGLRATVSFPAPSIGEGRQTARAELTDR